MRTLLAAALGLTLVGCAGSPGEFRNRPLAANPSAFIAAEIAFARLAQDKGQWTAFRETAHPDAVMFVPERVRAQSWLKTQTDPAEAVKWQLHAVYVSFAMAMPGRRPARGRRGRRTVISRPSGCVIR